jgi:CelD/BcsL family acetyltransferase involved in cellulose biosynthesis
VSLPRTNPRPRGLHLVDSPVAQYGIVEVDPQVDPSWQQLLDRVDSSVFHSPAWMRVLAETYGFELTAQVALDTAGKPVAGIPFATVRDIVGDRLVSLPFSDYCDPLVRDHSEWNFLSKELLTKGCPVVLKCLHNGIPLLDGRFVQVNRAKWHGLDLGPDLETLWLGLDEAARRAIRKAQRDGVVVRIAEDEETLRIFFEMHLRSRKYRYHLLAQPYQFFQNIHRLILEPLNGALMVATYRGEVIAGTLYLEWKDRLYYKFNASDPTHRGHRPNDLLVWEGIQYAKARGLRYLDFGLSDWDQETLVEYKRKFASEEKTISVLRYSPPSGTPNRERETRALLSRLTQLLTEDSVPDNVTERAGELLYRFFI